MSSTEQQTEVDEWIYQQQQQPKDNERRIQAEELAFHVRLNNDGQCSAKADQTSCVFSEFYRPVGDSLEDVEQLMISELILRLPAVIFWKWLNWIVLVVFVLGTSAYVSYALYYSFNEDVAILVLAVLSVVVLTGRLVWRFLADRLTNLWSATKSKNLTKQRMVISRSVYRSKCYIYLVH